MRIQHNILAMNAYRNYNTNTSALAKNLEKLSSGYKINRAGDDAAGLAISEKMRAQITGLEAAQKNVKDGISLVKTAEGAMQEIQDMLNRMDYLATQSANGTYQDEVDRENLNKEVEALKTEINRIADSANFNGIKLLDGSLDETIKAADAVTETIEVNPETSADMKVGGNLPDIGQILGTNTVVHNEADGVNGTQFDVDLHNFTFDSSKAGNTMTLTVGDTTFKLTVKEDVDANNSNLVTDTDAAKKLTGDELVNAILGKNANIAVEVNGEALSATKTFDNDGIEYAAGTGISAITINGQKFNVAANSKNPNTSGSLTFTQDTPPSTAEEQVDGSMKVSITGATAATNAKYSFDASNFTGGKITIDGEEIAYNTDLDTTFGAANLANYDVAVDGNTVTLTAKVAGASTAPEVKITAADGGDGTVAGTFKDGTAAVAGVYETGTLDYDTLLNGGTLGTASVTIGGISYTTVAGDTDLDTLIGNFVTAQNSNATWNVAAVQDANGKNVGVSFTAKTAGAAGTTGPAAPAGTTATTPGKEATAATQTYDLSTWNGTSDVTISGQTITVGTTATITANGKTYDVAYDADTKQLTLTAQNAGPLGSTGAPTSLLSDATFKTQGADEKVSLRTIDKGSDGTDLKNITQGSNGDWNVSTTNVKNVTAEGVNRLASTYFELTKDMVAEGSKLTIGGVEYTFTADARADTDVDISSDNLETIAQKLTEAAAGNSVWSVGVGKTPTTITLTETLDHAAFDDGKKYEATAQFDLRTKEGIEASLGFKGVTYTEEKVVSDAVEAGKALNLQIGDSSDNWNQMKVTIGDMHVAAMKTENEDGTTTSIADIDILTSDSAQAAVDVIKNAINYVSSVRGDLGAYQNRLEHTANNLSVMAENIQDAESTIRDTDIAEEMMAYTKNNILIQSAQAMLAQANAVPQGVLQLLG